MYLLEQFCEFLTSLNVFLRGVPLASRVLYIAAIMMYLLAAIMMYLLVAIMMYLLVSKGNSWNVPT